MESHPDPADVLADLGDKVVHAFMRAAEQAADDLAEYRAFRPGWVGDHSERGLANWIHDRLWARLVAAVDEMDGVVVIDREPIREIFVGLRYRLRVKRHGEDGSVSSYRTQGALDFYDQTPTLEGWEQVTLSVGYVWHPAERVIGAPVLSLRDGMDNLVWQEELRVDPDGGVVIPATPAAGGPQRPQIVVDGDSADNEADQETPEL